MHSTGSDKRIYVPHSVLRDPTTFTKNAVKDLFASFSIAWAIFIRDFSAKYRQTFAGYLSALVPVLITTISFVFLEKTNVLNFHDTTINYASFVFINTIVWELFVESCTGPTKELQNNIASIIRLNFPRESIFLASLLNVAANFLIKIGVAIVFVWAMKIQISWNLFLLIPLFLGLVVWGSLIGLLVLPVSILYSDFKVVVDFLLRLLFFLTPITYQIDYSELGHAWIPKFNVLSQYFTAIKEIIFFGSKPANFEIILLVSSLGLFTVIFGWIIYRISIPILIERMPS